MLVQMPGVTGEGGREAGGSVEGWRRFWTEKNAPVRGEKQSLRNSV